MHWFDWLLVGVWVLSIISTIATIGKPRDPTTPAVAVGATIVHLLLIVGMLITHGVLSL